MPPRTRAALAASVCSPSVNAAVASYRHTMRASERHTHELNTAKRVHELWCVKVHIRPPVAEATFSAAPPAEQLTGCGDARRLALIAGWLLPSVIPLESGLWQPEARLLWLGGRFRVAFALQSAHGRAGRLQHRMYS